MGKQMDRLMSLTRYQIIRMKEMDEFHLLSDDPQCVNVCFWYVPKRLRGQDLTEEVKIELGKVRWDIFNGSLTSSLLLNLTQGSVF